MPYAPEDGQPLSGALTRVLVGLDELEILVPAGARDRAQATAQGLFDAYGGGADGLAAAVVAYAAELVDVVSDDPEEVRRIADALQAQADVPRVALGRELLSARRPADLSLLRALTGARAVSLWAERVDADPVLVAHAGDLDPGPAGDETISLSIGRPVAGELRLHGVDAGAPDLGPLVAAAGGGVISLLERETLLDREHWREVVAGAVERRLARLRFDLHDGPQQDVILMAHDVRQFRDQLRTLLEGDPDQGRALGRLDDLEAQLIALDGDLRRLSTTVQSPFLSPGSLIESLQRVCGAFATRTGILPETDFSADLTDLSESQEIALLALVQEALSNVRKHSEASAVRVSIVSDPEGIRAEVSDDGQGFDLETTVARAARAGRLGIVGMHERLRMLGGQTRIESKPGGPTVVSAVLPRWGGEEDD